MVQVAVPVSEAKRAVEAVLQDDAVLGPDPIGFLFSGLVPDTLVRIVKSLAALRVSVPEDSCLRFTSLGKGRWRSEGSAASTAKRSFQKGM